MTTDTDTEKAETLTQTRQDAENINVKHKMFRNNS